VATPPVRGRPVRRATYRRARSRRAAGPDGSTTPTGSPAPPSTPFRQTLERPMAVVVDNVGGYPQHGINPATQVHEMPVEGSLTRLVFVFDRTDPERVGPVRSARDYMVDLSRSMDAVMVHDGGSPGALAAISATAAPTLNSFTRGELFSRGDGSAPYNLFAGGERAAAGGEPYRPRSRAHRRRRHLPTRSGPRRGGGDPLPLRRDVRDGVPLRARRQRLPLGQERRAGERRLGSGGAGRRGAGGVDRGARHPERRGGTPVHPVARRSGDALRTRRRGEGTWSLDAGQGVRFATPTGGVDLAPFKLWVVYAPRYDGALAFE
jgi:hypothetical protein